MEWAATAAFVIFGILCARMGKAQSDFQYIWHERHGLPTPPYHPLVRPGGKEPATSELRRRQDDPAIDAARRRYVKRVWLAIAWGGGSFLVAIAFALALS